MIRLHSLQRSFSIVALSVILLFLVAPATHAVDYLPIVQCGTEKDANGNVSNPCGVCDIFKVGKNVIDFGFYAVAPLAMVVALLAGGSMMIVSSTNAKLLSRGQTIITHSFVGLAIVMFSWVFINTIIKTFAPDQDPNEPWYAFKCVDLENLVKIDKNQLPSDKFVPNLPLEIGGGQFEGSGPFSGTITNGIPIENGKYGPYAGDVGCDVVGAKGTSIRAITGGTLRYASCATCQNGKPVDGTYHSAAWDCEYVQNGQGACAVSVSSDQHGYISYLHMTDYNHALRSGQTIQKGDLLGFVGVANNVPHVHIEFGDNKDPFQACNIVKQYVGSQSSAGNSNTISNNPAGSENPDTSFLTASSNDGVGQDGLGVEGDSVQIASGSGMPAGEGHPVSSSGVNVTGTGGVLLDKNVVGSFNTAIAQIKKAYPDFPIGKIDGWFPGAQLCHAQGLAFDINSASNYCAKNPYNANSVGCQSTKGLVIGNDFQPYIDKASVTQEIVQIFSQNGWCWGGNWNSFKDYMHFSRCANECRALGRLDWAKVKGE